MNIETIKTLKERAKEMLKDNYNRKIGDEEIYTIICELENFYTAYKKEKRLAETNLKDSKEYQDNMCNHRCILNSEVEELEEELEKEKEKNKKIEIIVNKLMPLAECSYWNYENHTCTHTCGGCDYLNEDNKRTSSGILIDKDRYCRLYEDGNAEKDTKFVDVEDLIKRHLKEE